MTKESRTKLVSAVLNRKMTDVEMQLICEDWKAFYDDPVKYSGSVVVKLVNEYLDGFNSTPEYKYINSGAQSVMEDEIQDSF